MQHCSASWFHVQPPKQWDSITTAFILGEYNIIVFLGKAFWVIESKLTKECVWSNFQTHRGGIKNEIHSRVFLTKFEGFQNAVKQGVKPLIFGDIRLTLGNKKGDGIHMLKLGLKTLKVTRNTPLLTKMNLITVSCHLFFCRPKTKY